MNLLTPFCRDKKRDFAHASGDDLLRSKVLQAIMTRGKTAKSEGELPWRTAFGASLDLFRHQNNDAVLAEIARVYVRDAIEFWVPEAQLLDVKIEQRTATLLIHVRFRPVGNTNRELNVFAEFETK